VRGKSTRVCCERFKRERRDQALAGQLPALMHSRADPLGYCLPPLPAVPHKRRQERGDNTEMDSGGGETREKELALSNKNTLSRSFSPSAALTLSFVRSNGRWASFEFCEERWALGELWVL
jgi:hypothetical protein